MSEDLKTIADEMQSIAFSIYEARTKRLQDGGQEELESIVLLQEAHDWLITLSATMDKFGGETIPEEPKDVTIHATEPIEDEETGSWLASELFTLMAEKGVTVTQTAEETGISRTTLNNILQDKTQNPHGRTLGKLEEYFGMEEGYLSE